MRSTIEKRAYRIIHEIAAVDYSEIKPEASFVDDLGMDDLDFIEMIMAVEKEFGLEIPDEDAEKFKTVGDLIKYLKEKVE
ncbi:acyl carrier protein [Chitinophaga solisilvae]|uniref:acyl carrier protein n=1 Tax=Chitinophaga solisilvae TaxID=1233460 RepID=UPI00136BCC5A|nr:acyl carrier protein [Chitinophaga solisilvae]